ncbi:MAG: hypothetical protein JW839_02530 [Candidatus Lokiarchaeota archaeon]|nr:hypothetical protein [Candidatus Lokiarchaeota archaeon]
MKVPVGAVVTVDLWNQARGNGMVRHEAGTLDLVRADSEFSLNKGDRAIVISSTDNYVKVIPKDSYSEILAPGTVEPRIDLLALRIKAILESAIGSTGGILALPAILKDFGSSSLKALVSIDHIRKACKIKDKPFDEIHQDGEHYLAIKQSEAYMDGATVLGLFKGKEFMSEAELKITLHWADVRLARVLSHLLRTGLLRKDVSYKDGTRYFLPGRV